MPKKGKKGKGKKDNEGGLPPPPDIDDRRQGALEALLAFKITGKEDIIEQYEEESEEFRDKNYKIKLENGYLRSKKKGSYNAMVRQSEQQNNAVYSSSGVSKEEVEEAKAEKMELARTIKMEMHNIEEQIKFTELQLDEDGEELKKWLHYKDVIQHQKAKNIATIINAIQHMKLEEEKTRVEVTEKLEASKARIEQRAALLAEREQKLVMQRMEANLDRDAKAELADNSWLKEQIAAVGLEVDALSLEVDQLEQRNLELVDKLKSLQTINVEKTKEVYFASLGRGKAQHSGLAQSPGLPSLVDVSKNTTDKMPGGQAGTLEMKTLSVQGHTAPFNHPPDTLHLPPLHQQSSHSRIPGGTHWPVTISMLKSL